MDFSRTQRAFTQTMRDYARVSKRGSAFAINKTAKDVGILTIKETPRADRGAVESSLKANGLVYRLINKGGLNKKQIEAKAKRFIRFRLRSIGYIAAGWYKAVQAFGARGGKTKAGGLAEQGRGEKATESRLTATLENRAFGATTVGSEPLARAMEKKRTDMMVYLARKLREGWGRGRG